MPVVEIICLANSIKWGGRCVAGLRTDGQGWVRPVSNSRHGSLDNRHYKLPDGSEPRPLDVLRISLRNPQPQPYQPENWLIDNVSWQLISRSASCNVINIIQSYTESGSLLFGNTSDRISFESLSQNPTRSSLALIIPKNLNWYITTSIVDKRQIRAQFVLSGLPYNLAITDPLWIKRLSSLKYGYHPLSAAGVSKDEKIRLVISLGEPFQDGYCYKLVAAIIILPDLCRNRF
ncbi:hypothetical protein DK28_0209205 [Peptococcaceae bacterium SCADC1_2_3]|jgi:hypothetical protein|nr:hypothetical protein DK28_0209205 [Peptococcaceae bacterium SCADC1_2_3]KFI35600.1 hypothetical protein HY00_03135 [Peptococcaceae bacterium SCADC1_2_3]KFI35621.1 hypothetical protein HY00_03280 [Peptococcaceae bacterium SCADC1_2_3]